jgi:hypothetical protein
MGTFTHLLKGDSRLKRIVIGIRMKKNPELQFSGYALVNELGSPMFSFFCTEKFPIDEELIVNLTVSGTDLEYVIAMSHLHEQISSGRIMNAVPTEEEPFPVRKFYRCFAKILKNPLMEQPAPQPLQAVPDVVSAPVTDAPADETTHVDEVKAA